MKEKYYCNLFNLKFYLESDYFFAMTIERRWVKANTQKVLREETLPNDEVSLPGVKTPSFYFCHFCFHSAKTWGAGYTVRDGVSFHDLPNTILPHINSYNSYNVTTHRALPNTGEMLPQKGIVKVNYSTQNTRKA